MKAHAKVNLALVVGERRLDGLHELASLVQRVELADDVVLEEAGALAVEGFPEDTLVGTALERLAAEAGVEPSWRVRLTKRIPLAAGLGGGSSDAAAALGAANATLERPLAPEALLALAAGVGSDVPFFLEPGPKLVEGTGERLTPVELPLGYALLLALPPDVEKRSTAEVYARFDELGGGASFPARRDALREAVRACRVPADLAALPPNDLAAAAGSGALAAEIAGLGALRADVTGAGPAVYGVFETAEQAERAAAGLGPSTRVWVTKPVW